MKHILILEDNESAMTALVKAIHTIDRDIHVCRASTLDEAFRQLFDYRIDVFILDIIVNTKVPGDTSGIKLAEQIRKNEQYLFTPIIFITALADPELYAYRELHSFGYLEKPFDMREGIRLIKKALKYRAVEDEQRIEYFRKDGILIAIDLNTVRHVQVNNHTLALHTKDDVLTIPYKTIKEFMHSYKSTGFIQCSRNAAVNEKYVKSIDTANRYIQMTDGSRVEIGPTFVKKIGQEKRYV